MADLLESIRMDLQDTGTSRIWQVGELEHCIDRAVDDLSRHLPREMVYETKLSFSVSDESFTSTGSAYSLANNPIKPKSETVTNAAGDTTYTRNTDYTMDYNNGTITIAAGDYLISYTKSKLAFDISDIISTAHRISRVEFPAYQVPQKFINFSTYGNLLYVGPQQSGKNQEELTEDIIAIYYECGHTAPGENTDGTYPALFNQIIAIGACGYALMMQAIKAEHQAVTDLASMRTELGLTTSLHTKAATALDKIATYLINNSGNDASGWLTKITTDIGNLRTAVDNALDAADTALANISTKSLDKATTGAEAYLDTGDANLSSVTDAPEAERYVNFTTARTNIANARAAQASQYVASAQARMSNLMSYIQQSTGYKDIAIAFAQEASLRLEEIGQHLQEAAQWGESVQGDLVLSDRYRTEGQARLNEFEYKLRNKMEYRKRTATVSLRQPA